MLTALRRSALMLMDSEHPPRRPALRRADSDDWLLASDIPQLLPAPQLSRLILRLQEAGWRTGLRGGWLYLDHPIAVPPLTHLPQSNGEASCLLSLLARHQESPLLEDRAASRALVKAAEQSGSQLETCCAQLHAACAARLRLHQPLPGALLPLLAALLAQKEDTTC